MIHRERSENLYGYYEQQLNPSENDQLGFTADEMGAFWRASHRSEQFGLGPGTPPTHGGRFRRRRVTKARWCGEVHNRISWPERGGGAYDIVANPPIPH